MDRFPFCREPLVGAGHALPAGHVRDCGGAFLVGFRLPGGDAPGGAAAGSGGTAGTAGGAGGAGSDSPGPRRRREVAVGP
ncbi:MAG: hypothetical protein M3083_04605, partial [Actinomycetota bacterium]|nr:hypothetical protein [Actinomycetota bacterium]